MDNDEITRSLHITPTISAKKGQKYTNNPHSGTRETNLWVWTFTKDNTISFNEQLSHFLSVLETKRETLHTILSQNGVSGELMLGYASESGQGGDYLSSETLKRISSLNLGILLDLYPPEEPNVNAS